jgi:cation transport regulator ChaB
MGAPENIVLKPLHGALPEQNRDIRARAWIFAFECYRKKAAPHGRPDDAERIKA